MKDYFFKFWFYWICIIMLIYEIGLGIHMVVTGHLVLRDGTIAPKIQAIIAGIFSIIIGSAGLCLFIIILRYEICKRKLKKSPFLIKCPSCGKEKEVSEYGRYKCRKCGQKFEARPDGTIVRINRI